MGCVSGGQVTAIAMHCEEEVDPWESVLVPLLQARQAAGEVALVLGRKVFNGQSVQDAAPAADQVPAWQEVQEEEPAGAAVPAGQRTQLEAEVEPMLME